MSYSVVVHYVVAEDDLRMEKFRVVGRKDLAQTVSFSLANGNRIEFPLARVLKIETIKE